MPHIHDKIDYTVEVFIVNNNRVLLRKHDKYGIWLSVGGHIELHEDPIEAVLREPGEEVGLDIELVVDQIPNFEIENYKELPVPRGINRHRINENHEHITLIYFAKSATDKVRQGKDEVSRELRWFTREDLDNGFYGLRPNVKHYARMALDAVCKDL